MMFLFLLLSLSGRDSTLAYYVESILILLRTVGMSTYSRTVENKMASTISKHACMEE